MSFDIDKEIFNLEEDIAKDENQLKDLNILYKQIPEDTFINTEKKERNIKDTIKALIDTSNIFTKIDKIDQSINPQEKLFLLNDLFHTEKISNPFMKKHIVNKLITDDILKLIEESFLNIKYPLFKGKILMTIFEQLNTENKQDLEIISLYLELYSYLVPDLYKEFPNFGAVNDLIKKNNENNDNIKFKFIEILPDILFKKIITTIFDESIMEKEEEKKIYINKLAEEEKKILYKFEKLFLYINKAISNTSELISLLASQTNDKNKKINFNKNIMIRYLICNLYQKLILFSISEKSSIQLTDCSVLLIILLIYKTDEQMNEFNNNYKYDPLKNISFYDFIRYYTIGTKTEKNVIEGQKKFNENIINQIKNNIINVKNIEMNKTEEILENITLMIKDIISLFETFRTTKLIEELLSFSCDNILQIFKDYYKNEIDVLYYKENKSLLYNIFFMTNLLYNFSLLCSNEFEFFTQRLILFDEDFKNKVSKPIDTFNSEANKIIKYYKDALISKIKFEKLFTLYNYNNLKKGNDANEIKNTFNEINEFWNKIKNILDNIQMNKKLVQSIINEVTKYFIKDLSTTVLNNIEKSDIEGKNLDVLIEKTKAFIENNFMNEDDVNEENKKDIIKLFSYLDNLYLNKK